MSSNTSGCRNTLTCNTCTLYSLAHDPARLCASLVLPSQGPTWAICSYKVFMTLSADSCASPYQNIRLTRLLCKNLTGQAAKHFCSSAQYIVNSEHKAVFAAISSTSINTSSIKRSVYLLLITVHVDLSGKHKHVLQLGLCACLCSWKHAEGGGCSSHLCLCQFLYQ